MFILYLNQAPAVQPYTFSEAACAEYIAKGKKAMSEGDMEIARDYFKRAIQEDPWNNAAWENYDRIISGGKIEVKPKKKAKPEIAPKETEEVEFEGC
jgi:tetratricopeptide (TPR) repeat protein